MILVLLIVIILLAGGGFGYSRYGLAGFSPLGIIILVLLILWLTGNLHIPNNLRL
jgi:hypothetical protein